MIKHKPPTSDNHALQITDLLCLVGALFTFSALFGGLQFALYVLQLWIIYTAIVVLVIAGFKAIRFVVRAIIRMIKND